MGRNAEKRGEERAVGLKSACEKIREENAFFRQRVEMGRSGDFSAEAADVFCAERFHKQEDDVGFLLFGDLELFFTFEGESFSQEGIAGGNERADFLREVPFEGKGFAFFSEAERGEEGVFRFSGFEEIGGQSYSEQGDVRGGVSQKSKAGNEEESCGAKGCRACLDGSDRIKKRAGLAEEMEKVGREWNPESPGEVPPQKMEGKEKSP